MEFKVVITSVTLSLKESCYSAHLEEEVCLTFRSVSSHSFMPWIFPSFWHLVLLKAFGATMFPQEMYIFSSFCFFYVWTHWFSGVQQGVWTSLVQRNVLTESKKLLNDSHFWTFAFVNNTLNKSSMLYLLSAQFILDPFMFPVGCCRYLVWLKPLKQTDFTTENVFFCWSLLFRLCILQFYIKQIVNFHVFLGRLCLLVPGTGTDNLSVTVVGTYFLFRPLLIGTLQLFNINIQLDTTAELVQQNVSLKIKVEKLSRFGSFPFLFSYERVSSWQRQHLTFKSDSLAFKISLH